MYKFRLNHLIFEGQFLQLNLMRKNILFLTVVVISFTTNIPLFAQEKIKSAIIKSEDIFSKAPFTECHASSIAETAEGLAVAFFAGTAEKNPDVGIWLSLCHTGKWTEPMEIANGITPEGKRFPCWNPVLFYAGNGKLLLFYKVGPDPVSWWGMMVQSTNDGHTWSTPSRLPDGYLGPVRNKPIQLSDGDLICPASDEQGEWKVYFERTSDQGNTWSRTEFVNDPENLRSIQPSILVHKNGYLQALCRTRKNVIGETWSMDCGATWSPLKATRIPNPNSGIDAVALRDGRHLLVYNPTIVPEGRWTGDRTPISLAISKNGKKWRKVYDLDTEPGELSYPAVIQAADGKVHITYTWKRITIRHIIIDPEHIP